MKYYSGIKNYIIVFILLTFTSLFCIMFTYVKDIFIINSKYISGIFTLFCIAVTFTQIFDTLLNFLKEDKYDK